MPNFTVVEGGRGMKTRPAFTLFKLVVVVLILGIMAGYAAARIMDHFQTKTKQALFAVNDWHEPTNRTLDHRTLVA